MRNLLLIAVAIFFVAGSSAAQAKTFGAKIADTMSCVDSWLQTAKGYSAEQITHVSPISPLYNIGIDVVGPESAMMMTYVTKCLARKGDKLTAVPNLNNLRGGRYSDLVTAIVQNMR